MSSPLEAGTLVDMLVHRAETSPSATAVRWQGAELSYREVLRGAAGVAELLTELGVGPGERIVLALPNGPGFLFALYGVLAVGGTAVPIFPGPDVQRWRSLARLAGAATLLLPGDLEPRTRTTAERLMSETGTRCVASDALITSGPASIRSRAEPGQVAIVQFTSGSTADPKGVQLTHHALMTNIRQMVEGMRITPGDRFVSWLPVYHDMGLVLKTMAPFAVGAPLLLLPTSLHRPGLWLDAITGFRGTFTAAPDSAFRLATYAVRGAPPDLSTLRVALNAAEPVRVSTFEAFERGFGLEHVMVAGYGLAEATVGVSMIPPGTPPRLDAQGHVSVGRPFPGIRVTVPPAAGASTPELRVHTPAATIGYLGNAAATRELFDDRGAIRTGDVGTVDEEGYVYVFGRSKEVIIQGGRSLYAADVEELAEEAAWVRRAAAVGIEPRPDAGEQLYVFIEARSHSLDAAEAEARVSAFVRRVHGRFGLRPGRVYIVRPKTIPMTPNGKKRRQELRDRYLDRTLSGEHLVLFPSY